MKLQNFLNTVRNYIRISTLLLMFTAVVIATAAGFAHSYAGLYDWGVAHKLTSWKADTFPLLVDMFILVGELGLFLIALDGLKVRKSLTSWMDILIPSVVVAAGWGASLWFNIHHLRIATTDDQITFAIPPIAAMIGLMILLRTIHRYAARLESASKVPAAGAGTDVVPLVVPEAVPAPAPRYVVARTGIVRVPTLYRAGTYTRSIWPVLAPDLVRTTDHGTVPALEAVKPVHTANGNGVLSEPSQNGATPERLNGHHILDGAEKAAQTREPVPVREPSDVLAKPTAADSGPHIQPPSDDDRWDNGLKYVMDYYAVTGKLPGQRPLAAHLGMANRNVARDILIHAKEMINRDQITNGVPEAANTAG